MDVSRRIEEKWQRAWEVARIFEADPSSDKNKYFITVAYPYPNSPQHIGHGRTYTLTDVHARYMRMQGYNVLFPMAFHYTGTPILAMSKRLAAGDKELMGTFLRTYKVSQEALSKFTEPIKIARHFHEEIKMGMREIGYSIDWRREFTSIDPQYSRFIEWQFNKLREAGYISQGSHPVGWCPSCGNPVGQHDTKGDVEPEFEEFTLIKFRCGEYFLPAATLRPETVFGVTNMWLNPKAEYVKTKVDDEHWIVTKEGADKLSYLGHHTDIIETFPGKELIGEEITNPATNGKILILPADFVDPKNATGVVMSVPGHAPYDYVALERLRRQPHLVEEYGLKPEAILEIQAISIIHVPKYSNIPAADVVKQMGIENQLDPRLEEATKEVYRHEFHNGTMRDNTGKYSEVSVAEARERVKEDLIEEGKAGTMYELINKPVVCRCGTECVVKIFEDQWFINYGSPQWKALAHKCLDRMSILPEEMRSEFNYVIDWLREKACARKAGLGTKLPWDPEWIIESLSDSVIYMAYYVISKHVKTNDIKPNQLTNAVFDHLFLGIGDPNKVAKEASLNPKILEGIRSELLYFYPLDSRHSGRDLVPNHLTFMIFVHTAIFPTELWPRQIVVNGSVLMEGQKMSKSLGNIIPLREAIKKFGADALRLAILITAEPLQDADFSPALARSMGDRLERFHRTAVDTLKIRGSIKEEPLTTVDRWMRSRLQEHIKMATEAMDKLMVRKAIHSALYMLDQDLQWYLRRISEEREKPEREGVIASVLNDALNVQVRMLAPVAPHLCEEIWEKMDGEGFVSLASWPTYEENKVDVKAEQNEALVRSVLDDTLNIIKATGITPKRVFFYTAASWKWDVYLKSLEKSVSTRIGLSDLMREVMGKPELRKIAERVAKFTASIIEEVNRMAAERKRCQLQTGIVDENRTLREAKSFLERELKAQIRYYQEDDPKRHDPEKRAGLARPYRPAIYIQ